jgi:hypothetical protein
VKVVWWFLHLQNRDSQKAIVSQWFSALTAISVTRDFLFFLVLESERRALCMLGKHLTTELHPQAKVFFVLVEIIERVHFGTLELVICRHWKKRDILFSPVGNYYKVY